MSPCRLAFTPRFRDLDALGHVNNAVFLTYFEEGRLHYLRSLGVLDPAKPSILIARVEVDYLRPVLLGEALTLEVHALTFGRTSFRLGYDLAADGQPCARSTSVQVWVGESGTTPEPLPERVRAAIAAFEGREIPVQSSAGRPSGRPG
ncbi:MAG TPA: thioesterase family protein [Deinococcales bacterium]|nr:thioesterase family protein [Deinococcales bacterium]